MMSVCEAVAVAIPVTSFADLEGSVEELVQLQKRAAEIERRAKVLRGEIKEGLARCGLRKFSTTLGHSAVIVESTSWHADKQQADKLLDPEVIAMIFRPTFSSCLRVK